jgi:hypothetical protein
LCLDKAKTARKSLNGGGPGAFSRGWQFFAQLVRMASDEARYADPILTHGRVAAHAAGTWAPRMTEDNVAPAMEGECRIEANSPSGRKVVLEGLRVRLDLRIVPGSGSPAADGNTEAVLRVASAKITTVTEARSYLHGALWAGLGALTLALVVWFASAAPEPLVNDPGARSSNVGAPGEAMLESAGRTPIEKSFVPEKPAAPERETPAVAPILAPPPVPHAPAVVPLRRGPPLPRRAPFARADSPPSHAPSPPPVAAKLASSGDMLDLFEDPK